MRPKLTYANVIATLALFIAIGGGAYAATQLPKNSVGTKQIKKQAVKKKNIAKNAVVSSRIADGAVQTPDLAAGAVDSGKLAAGAVGTEKIADAAVTAAKIAPGVLPDTSVIARRSVEPNVGTGTQSTTTATCEAGEHAVGGGAAFVTATNLYDFPATVQGSVPTTNGLPSTDGSVPDGWRASALNQTGATRNFVVVVLCQPD